MPTLILKNLTRAYGSIRAVDNVSLVIKDGEFLSLLGPSGCGKTTTLRMIAGFIDPTGGTIEVDGRVLSQASGSVPPERRGMSMIFQSYAIWPNMTVGQNVAFGLTIRKLPEADIKKRVDEVLDVVQLGRLAHRYPAELSGGQQQRVALARAIVVQPSVLLLDEPLSNLDANLREEMRTEIRRLHEAFRITTVYVTHDQAEAMATSDRIAVMNGGRVEQVDAPYTIYARPKTRFVAGFIGRTNFLDGIQLNGQAMFDGFTVHTSRLENLNLTSGGVTISVRPQSLVMTAAKPAEISDRIYVQGQVTERTFLGEHWDYLFTGDGSKLALKVAARPTDIFEIGAKVWLALDPMHMVVIQ
jgi:ABC-type Fe3+/spermidine/putrescine transport system ATPase subunit